MHLFLETTLHDFERKDGHFPCYQMALFIDILSTSPACHTQAMRKNMSFPLPIRMTFIEGIPKV
ncbi:hypothetical protein DPMN_057184 [Dreissena polymorpha]|uniref:Uncharacterized protein n=1 Tax=Dreissena polymorpha TaxID=45954 RepID=A0A9D4CT22_DREPO|nr:hypothetical protein DPMN_057184 [Dreissena polymorpha]